MRITTQIKNAVETAEKFSKSQAQISAAIDALNGLIVSFPATFSSKEDNGAILECLDVLHKIKGRCDESALKEYLKKI